MQKYNIIYRKERFLTAQIGSLKTDLPPSLSNILEMANAHLSLLSKVAKKL